MSITHNVQYAVQGSAAPASTSPAARRWPNIARPTTNTSGNATATMALTTVWIVGCCCVIPIAVVIVDPMTMPSPKTVTCRAPAVDRPRPWSASPMSQATSAMRGPTPFRMMKAARHTSFEITRPR